MDKFSILNKYRSASSNSHSNPVIQNPVIDSSDESIDDNDLSENRSDPIEPDSDDSSASVASLNESIESGSNEIEDENDETDSESDDDSSHKEAISKHPGNKPGQFKREDSSSDDFDTSDEEDESEENSSSTPNVGLKNKTAPVVPQTEKTSQPLEDSDDSSTSSDDESGAQILQTKSTTSKSTPTEKPSSSSDEDSDESDSKCPKPVEKSTTAIDCLKTAAPPPAPPPPPPTPMVIQENKPVSSAKKEKKAASQSEGMSSVLDSIKNKNFKLKSVNEKIKDPSKETQTTVKEANSNGCQPNAAVRKVKAKSQQMGSVASELSQIRPVLSNGLQSPKVTERVEEIKPKTLSIHDTSIHELEIEELELKLLLVQKKKSILTERRSNSDENAKLVSNSSWESSKAEMENALKETKNVTSAYENRENACKTQDSTALHEYKQNHKQFLGSVLGEILNQGFRLKPTKERRSRLAKAKDKSQEEALKDALIKISKAYHNDGEDSAYNDSHSEWDDQELIEQ